MPHNRTPKPGAKYYLPKYQYKTVVNFCFQYAELKAELATLDGWHSGSNDGMPRGSETSDPTYQDAVRREEISRKIDLIEKTVRECSGILSKYFLPAITDETCTYHRLASQGLPLNHKEFSMIRRKIYYTLSKRI